MENEEGLSSLGVDSVGPRARDTARTLLEAYYLQDRREMFLRRERPTKASDAGQRALDRMATTYEREFPGVPSSQARSAGESFMRALFLQDEVENWAHLRSAAQSLSEVLLSGVTTSYGVGMETDPRWERVEASLRTVCERTGIDERYADLQTAFWLRHGQDDDSWERLALEAHELKARAMIDDAPAALVATLGEYFVEGVKRHDTWGREHRESELARLETPVARYYQKVFQWRSAHR